MIEGEIVLTIPGHPAPKGSLKCIGARGGRGHVLIEDNARTKDWRKVVAVWSKKKITQRADHGQPVGAEVSFTLDRPKSHYGTGRNAHQLKASAPAYPVGHNTGDIDKLIRLICDALQDAEVLHDDCQVVELVTRKAYPIASPEPDAYDRLPYPGVRIRLYPIERTT